MVGCWLSSVESLNLAGPELLDAIEQAAEDASPHLVLDLADIESIDSTGLRFLMNVHRLLEARGGRLGLVNPSEPVLYLLTLTRLDTFFAVESTAGGNGA